MGILMAIQGETLKKNVSLLPRKFPTSTDRGKEPMDVSLPPSGELFFGEAGSFKQTKTAEGIPAIHGGFFSKREYLAKSPKKKSGL